MKVSLFGLTGIPLGKHNVKDARLDQTHQLVEAKKKTYVQVDVAGEEEAVTPAAGQSLSAKTKLFARGEGPLA